MREQIIAVLSLVAETAGPGRVTPIVVAAITAVAGIVTALIVAFARKDCDHPAEIDRLERLLWQHGIDPVTGQKVVSPP